MAEQMDRLRRQKNTGKRMVHKLPPKSGTQCWSVRRMDAAAVCEHMERTVGSLRITDCWIMTFPDMTCLNFTLAGQHGQQESATTANMIRTYLPAEPEWGELRSVSFSKL